MPVRKPIDLKKGYIIKLGSVYYEILDEEPLTYRYDGFNYLAAAANNIATMEELQPGDQWIYWIIGIGLEALNDVGIRLEYPRGIIRGNPTRIDTELIDSSMAHPINKYIYNFFIKPQSTMPTIYVENNSAFTSQARVHFEGFKFFVKVSSFREGMPFTDVTDYSNLMRGV